MDYDFCRRMNFELMKTVDDPKNKNMLEECLTDKKVMMNLCPFVATLMTGKSMPRTIMDEQQIDSFFVHLSDRLTENTRDTWY